MDDREFLDELEHVEPASAAADSAHVRERTLEELEEGLPLAVPEYPREVRAVDAPRAIESATVPDLDALLATPDAREPRTLSGDQMAWLATAFLTLMLAGAAGAALLFHHRIADIVALLH